MLPQQELSCGGGGDKQRAPPDTRQPVSGQQLQEEPRRGTRRRRHGWGRQGGRGRKRGGGRWVSGHHHHHHHHHHQLQRPAPGGVMSLRPVNIKGNRVRGMRAPKNTNQFLMHEKYQLLHMRSDSVGTDSSSGSDSDVDFTDMDSYLGVLENARGALLDSPDPHSSRSPVRLFPHQQQQVCVFCPAEESLQYFPSEDDVLQSQDFMQKDFVEFCDTLTQHTS
ncbi:uncharacterized protein ACJ7VT_011041 [Polymixia lowei]